MRTPRLAEPPDQHVVGRIEKDEHGIQVADALQAPVRARQFVQHLALAHVNDDRRARHLAAGPQRQLREHREQRHRQIVHAEVPEVLERADRLGFARPREPREDDEARGDGGARGAPCRVALLAHQKSSP